MADRTPIETARRVWPGEWRLVFPEHTPKVLRLTLSRVGLKLEVAVGWSPHEELWHVRFIGRAMAKHADLAEALSVAHQKLALAVAELARTVGAPDVGAAVGAAVGADPCPWCGPGSAMVAETVLRDGCADGEPGAWGCSIRCRGCSGEGPWGKGNDQAMATRSAISNWNRRCDPSERLASMADLARERDEALALAEERRVRLMLVGEDPAPGGWRYFTVKALNGEVRQGLQWVHEDFVLRVDNHGAVRASDFETSRRVLHPSATEAWTHAQALRSFIAEHGALPPSESAKDTP